MFWQLRLVKQGIMWIRIGKGVGNVVNKFFAAGRETIDMFIKNILPFMAFTALPLLGIISASGLVILSPTQSLRCVEHFRECSLFPLFVDWRSCHRFWDLELLLHRLLVLCLERSSRQVLFLLSMHFLRIIHNRCTGWWRLRTGWTFTWRSRARDN